MPMRRVLLIALDGTRPDAVRRFAPCICRFGEQDAQVTTWDSRVEIPISAASWATVLTGLYHTRTGIANNAFTTRRHPRGRRRETPPRTPRTPRTPRNRLSTHQETTVFQLLAEASLRTSLVSTGAWDGLLTLGRYAHTRGLMQMVHLRGDEETRVDSEYHAFLRGCTRVLSDVRRGETSLITFSTSYVDSVGHLHGFCTSSRHHPYVKAVARVDRGLHGILECVRGRERSHAERWLVVLTTDHGGSSRTCMQRSAVGRRLLAQFDGDPNIHAGISQRHAKGIHGLVDDRALHYQHTRAFVIVGTLSRTRTTRTTNGDTSRRRSRRRSRGDEVTNADITPTIVQYLLHATTPHMRRLMHSFDGRPIPMRLRSPPGTSPGTSPRTSPRTSSPPLK